MNGDLVGCVLLSIAALAPRIAPAADTPARSPAPSWDVTLAPPDEPGERLVVTGTVYRRKLKANGRFIDPSAPRKLEPAPGVLMRVYHADAEGRYALNMNDPPRLLGWIRTNAKGQYRFHTILPRGYGGQLPHVHYEIWRDNVRQQSFLLEFDRVPSAPAGKQLSVIPGAVPPRDPTANIQRVQLDQDGVLHCTRDLVIGVH